MSTQTRWWEYYYVRYFVGTAFAVPMMLLLGRQEPWSTAFGAVTGQGSGWLTASGVATGGLAFCYIASTPILLLHTMRAKIRSTPLTYKVTTITIGIVAIGSLLALCLFGRKTNASSESALLIAPFVMAVLAQLLLLSCGMFRSPTQSQQQSTASQSAVAPNIQQVRDFYVDTALKRAEAFKGAADARSARVEYMESYRHLREHGNAVLILIAEAILTLALLYSASFVTAGLIIFLWVLPSTMVWPMATWLEASLDSASTT